MDGKTVEVLESVIAKDVYDALWELREAVGDYLAPHPSRSHPGSGGDPDAAQRLQRVPDAYAEALRREPVTEGNPNSMSVQRRRHIQQHGSLEGFKGEPPAE